MKYYGFNDGWGLAGLKNYFEKYSRQPVSQYLPHCTERPLQSWSVRGGTGSEAIDLDALADISESCQ